MTDCPHPEKFAHRSKAAALKARESLETAQGVDLALRPYKCGDHWHLGHRGRPPARVQIERALRAGTKNARKQRRRRTR